jgi:hypothetical protein
MGANQLCFVLMPFGRKPDDSGRSIDFDCVYTQLIAPAVRAAGLDPLRADEELDQGIIHKAMFERLLLCEYAVADVTLANANVFYELGIRHAARPLTTILVAADQRPLPFDVAMLRVVPYSLSSAGEPETIDADKERLADRLNEARAADSPIYQLINDLEGPQLDKLAAYRPEYLRRGFEIQARIAACTSVEEVTAVEAEVGSKHGLDVETFLALLGAYRRWESWADIVRLAAATPSPVGSLRVVRERLAFAQNRAGTHAEAERTLTALHEQQGETSESLGLLGRVCKDRWRNAEAAGTSIVAEGLLQRAIDAYRAGFDIDWRDWYPGVNAVTLMRVQGDHEGVEHLLPIVRYAVSRDIARGRDDYWIHATELELDAIGRTPNRSRSVSTAVARDPEPWQLRSTIDNLRLLLRDPDAPDWLSGVVSDLTDLAA